jgi:UDP-GlcNAc:undecaprenyl-phosphate/decaprenyl-phosphate GlcNAc-1-phosphate transferase
LIFGVAIFDTIFVMLLRSLRGISPFLGSKDHYAIRLKMLGWPVTRIVVISYSIGSVLGALAILNMFLVLQTSLVLYGCVALFFAGIGLWLSRVKIA